MSFVGQSDAAGVVVVVDDDEALCDLLTVQLRQRGFVVRTATSGATALPLVHDADVLLTDVAMEGMSGLELCATVVRNHPTVPVVIMTASDKLETSIAAIRAGAYDFVTKPLDLDVLVQALERAMDRRRLEGRVAHAQRMVAQDVVDAETLIGESPALVRVRELIARVADSDLSILITGETGTGKELVARALHQQSARRAGPLITVNCSAIPEPLLESELFGHIRGAFTDARTDRAGLFVEANGGTLFLDEIGEMPPALQPKLLRALQERMVRPVGATTEVPIDVRVIAATNRDLAEAMQARRFRDDLYFRLAVIQIDLPPLRARGDDVLLLAQRFLRAHAAERGRTVVGVSAATAERLLAHTWPGNVRELENCMQRAVVLATRTHIVPDDLPPVVRMARRHSPLGDGPSLDSLADIERRHILQVVRAVGGNRTVAARVLGLDRKTLYRKLAQYESDERARR